MKHKHADLIHKWAEGADIEYRNQYTRGTWLQSSSPTWQEDTEYRVKPKDIVKTLSIKLHPSGEFATVSYADKDNVAFTFYSETGTLKGVELL